MRGFPSLTSALTGAGGDDSNLMEGTLGIFGSGGGNFFRPKGVSPLAVFFLTEAGQGVERRGPVPRETSGLFFLVAVILLFREVEGE